MLNPIILNEVAKARQRDWLREADENRRARQIRIWRLTNRPLAQTTMLEPQTECCEQECA